MLNLTTNQLLNLWGQLTQAYDGVNSYGRDVAEIYLFECMVYCPSVERGDLKEKKLIIKMALDSLNAVLDKFTLDWDCTLEVDGVLWSKDSPLGDIDMDTTRFHIKVIHN